MSQLFSKSAIRQAISSFEWLNIDKEIAIVQELYEDFRKWNMKDETRYEQNFNELFFHQLLGYDPKINLHPKASTPVGSKIADVWLGFFEDGLYSYEGVKVVVELKWCDILLDKKQASYGGQSPVDQGFGYKTSFKDCPWLIVSNFASVRLYRDNKQDFEVWTIEELANPDNDYYNLKTLLGLLKRNHLISQEWSSFSEKLLSEVRINQEVITKRFYQDYKNLRLELINDIRQHNPATHVEIVVEKAQKIIDRIIFIHFCEDKDLLPEWKLKANVVKAREIWFSPRELLKRFFLFIAEGSPDWTIPKYNGWLFAIDPVLNNLEIGDAICHKFIDLGNYSFDDELSVNILGHIFEQSISDIEQLKGELIESTVIARSETSTLGVRDEAIHSKDPSGLQPSSLKGKTKESKRKKDGIFYTPEYIVDYIVQNSLMVYLEEKEQACLYKVGKKSWHKTELEAYQAYQHILQNIKVLDPACGSGAFLVKVFDYLYAENKRVGQIVKSLFDDDEIYKSILRNNIYGVDLNPESVEITKLSLWLKSAQKGKKLNNLDDNIKCGNSLIDDPAVAGDRAFDWQKEFSQIVKDIPKMKIFIDNIRELKKSELLEIEKKYWLEFIHFNIDWLLNDKNTGHLTELHANKESSYSHAKYTWITEIIPTIIGNNIDDIRLIENTSIPYKDNWEIIEESNNFNQLNITDQQKNNLNILKEILIKILGEETIKKNFPDFLVLINSIAQYKNITHPINYYVDNNSTYCVVHLGYIWKDNILVTDDQKWIFTKENREKIFQELEFKIINTSEIKMNVSNDLSNPYGFDVIVGNPPYVSTKSTKFIGDEKSYFQNNFEVAEYQTDTYPLFVEQWMKILKSTWILWYIMPNSWLNNLKFSKLRKYLLEQNIREITLLPSNVFADATVDTVNIFISKQISKKDFVITQYENSNFTIKNTIWIDRLLKNDNYIFDINTTNEISKIINKMKEKILYIKDILEISTWIKEYQVWKWRPKQTQADKDNLVFNADYQKDSTFKKQLRGSDIDRYSIKWRWWYVSYGERLAEPRNPKFFEGNNILMRQIPWKKNLIVSYVVDDYIIDQSIYVGKYHNHDFNIKYILSLLNSQLLWFYFKHSQWEFDSIFPKIKIDHFKQLPIKIITLKDQQPFIEKADLMLSLNKELHDKTDSFLRYISSKFWLEKLSTKLQKFYDYDFATFLKELNPRTSVGQRSKLSMTEEAELMEFFETKKSEIVSLKNRIDSTDREIDEMVYTLYWLNDEEKKVVEGS